MNCSKQQLWERFQKYHAQFPEIGLSLDLSRMTFPDDFFSSMEPRLQQAYRAMAELEKGGIANRDEKRMVGHYWLRDPERAPNPEIKTEIQQTWASIKSFAADVHAGKVRGARGPFEHLLLVGIGGSALGAQFVADALGSPGADKLTPFFLDNSAPDGIDNVLSQLKDSFGVTICIVVSKSGGTKERRNGMLETAAAYKAAGLDFVQNAVAVTSHDSALDKIAAREKWLARFPMWDWGGGRTATGQHSYIKQLRYGMNNFLVIFVEVLCDRSSRSMQVDPGVTSGDYLEGFYLSTREALFESDRQSVTITVKEVSPFTAGVLIALFERAVGFYASLINVNAYHQPGVEAGKKAASAILDIEFKVQSFLSDHSAQGYTPAAIAEGIGVKEQSEAVFKICEHLAANQGRNIEKTSSDSPAAVTYRFRP